VFPTPMARNAGFMGTSSLAQLPHRCASGDLKPAEFRGLAEGQAICGAKSALPLCWNPAARLDSERVAVAA
jgi:hypothetical protein